MKVELLETEQNESIFAMVGGDLSLDFTNTVGGWRGVHGLERDKLHSYADLVSWAQQAGALTETEAGRLLAEGSHRPSEAQAALRRAIHLREAIYKVFSAVAEGRQPRPADLETINSALSRAQARARLVPGHDGFDWGWEEDPRALDRMLWPVVRSAADLLTSGDLSRVRECSGDTCGWLFVDMSRNRSRRWCDMNDCGNRAKAKRHYHRARTPATA